MKNYKINDLDLKILQRKYKDLNQVIEKIEAGYPIQYLIGDVDFCGYKIIVNKNVLIPRFETELLVKKTLKYIKKFKLNKASVLEIGTGSGCISVVLKSELPLLEITAIDISRKALKVARKNAKLNKIKVNFICKDLFKYNLVNKYDILISNPPYLTRGDDVDKRTNHEPQIALYAEDSGLSFYKKTFEIAKKSLNKKFLIALEIDEDKGKELKSMAKKYFPKAKVRIETDLPGKDRYLFVSSE